MAKNSKHEAMIPNPALKPFSALIGEWETVGTHGLLPDTTYHGHTSFQWIEGGAFLVMHSEIDEPGIPSSVVIIGSDDATNEFFMLYFDERGVSRKYDFSCTKMFGNGGGTLLNSRSVLPSPLLMVGRL